ncbi:hypothetical protein ASD83_14035 [Devosia sp. Root685]|nr:hypothetical protein ASD83_14035 [Devosia sp. Root685]
MLDFSDRTIAEFFEDEFGIEIYQERYGFNGTSKARHVRAFIEVEDAHIVGHVCRRLWKHREGLSSHYTNPAESEAIRSKLFDLLARLEEAEDRPRADAIERFSRDQTLEELVASIEREIHANKPVAALDRLHTYCMKKFGHMLDERGIEWDRAEPLHSRVGRYVKALKTEGELREMSEQIIKNAVGVAEKFNHVRNNKTLAHDNDLINPSEARFIFDSINALLRFIKSVDGARFGS